jgi:predicted nucleic acid-binding protein
VIYLDSSVALAKLLAEDRNAPELFWNEELVSSRLLEYEVWTRIHARRLADELGEQASVLLDLIEFVELAPPVLARALEPFPLPLRTLDALHLASIEYIRGLQQTIELATFDRRMRAAGVALGIGICEL